MEGVHEISSVRWLFMAKRDKALCPLASTLSIVTLIRICPGITLGLQVVHFILASLIHRFEINKPSDEPVDMTESFGLSSMKATPLHVILAPPVLLRV
ncbi:hypothetical protein RJ639_044573 [Escallonia herrerae]|uniref:Uncharacterized protein n=1 Tax=Escallonia herrerae TaxID=1293975 RepID=A0AA88WGN9_9ASTE|nr:hypothetical protein RJ639_044573 [Escallonia herrerae]